MIVVRTSHISWIIVILLGSLFSSCINQNSWKKTNDGELLFVGDNAYTYDWEGETFENLIHGQGILIIFDGDSLIDSISVNAYYGSINAQDVVNVNDTTKYIGDIKWKKQEGYGVLIQPHNIYVGNFTNSKPHGNLSWYQDGVLRYKGEWIEGKREGYGISYDKDGVYSGLFSNNQYKGEGEKYYKNGSSYDGEWNNGMRSGLGNLITKDISYTGDFLNGLPNGEGTLTIGDTVFTYNGNWLNGKMSQYGECTYANGDFYEGEWNDGFFNGFGVCRYANGDAYEGYWKDGLQDGNGRYVNKDFTYVGEWEGGWINGEGQMNFTNGDWYEGDFYQNERFGVGCYHFKNGNRYEGEFVNDTINGLGIFYFQDGSRYEGEFDDGKIFGDGTLHLNVNGESISITAFWDGTHNMPTEASVLFGNGDLYEGELINGLPTANGVWSTQKERDEGLTYGQRANDFYKEHREAWNKAVLITSLTLTTVEILAPYVCAAAGSFIPGAGTAAGYAVGQVISKVAGAANIGLNALDASMAISSAAYDVKESYDNGEDTSDAYKTLGLEVGLNVGLVLLPKGLKKIPFGKVAGKLSNSAAGKVASKFAKKAGTHIGNAGGKMAKTSVARSASSITKSLKNKGKKGFQKMVKIGRDKSDKLEKVFLNSKTGKKANQIFKSAEKRIKKISADITEAKENDLAKKHVKKNVSSIGKNASESIVKDINHYLNSTSIGERGSYLHKIKYKLDKLPPEQKVRQLEKMPKELRAKVEKVKIVLPKNNGRWMGESGNSMWVPDDNYCPPNKNYGNQANKVWSQIKKENNIEGILYKDGELDMSNVSIATMSIDWEKELGPDFKKIMLSKKSREKLQDKAFEIYAQKHNLSSLEVRVFKGDSAPVERLMKKWNCCEQEVWSRCGNPNRKTYVWHESTDCKTLELVPTEVHHNVSHTGGISLVKAELSN